MCGIAGYICLQPYPDALATMTGALRHRGPDGQGHHLFASGCWHVGLGHRRLAIIDLEGGLQPVVDAADGDALTYNGEVYNFALLRHRLVSQGRVFRSKCDTEVVFQHLQANGHAAVGDLDGMFAFAYWNHKGRSLCLARDPVGIKPLYYSHLSDGGIIFASELMALARHPACSRDVDLDALAWYLTLDYIPAPGSMLSGVRKLPPGHMLVWRDDGSVREHAYWEPHLAVDSPSADIGLRLRRKLYTAVEEQMVADVPLGVFLSGGIDSSTIAAVAAKVSTRPINTFSIGFEDADYDESTYASCVAQHIGSHHIVRTLSAEDMLECLPLALGCLDEPLADPSIVPTWMVSKVAADHVKVCLGGDGGDELFGGYPTLKAHRIAAALSALPDSLRNLVGSMSTRWLPHSDSRHNLAWKLRRFFERFDRDPYRRHLRWMSTIDLTELQRLFTRPTNHPLLESLYPGQTTDLLADIMRLDLQTYLPGSVLAKVDRASMSHSLEVRPPFLHRDVINLALAIPSKLKYRNGTGKLVLKSAVRDLLPGIVISRPKRGFGIPLQNWIRGPLKDRVQAVQERSLLWERTPLSRESFTRMVSEHASRSADHAKPIWSFLVLDDWMRRLAQFR